MAMEKRGVIEPGKTVDYEDRLPQKGEKQAASKQQCVQRLDDDFTRRAADTASKSLKES